jgi:hypothetical protein
MATAVAGVVGGVALGAGVMISKRIRDAEDSETPEGKE